MHGFTERGTAKVTRSAPLAARIRLGHSCLARAGSPRATTVEREIERRLGQSYRAWLTNSVIIVADPPSIRHEAAPPRLECMPRRTLGKAESCSFAGFFVDDWRAGCRARFGDDVIHNTIEMKAVHTSVATAARMMYSEKPVDEFDAARMAVKMSGVKPPPTIPPS
jgi:hypothetical protein